LAEKRWDTVAEKNTAGKWVRVDVAADPELTDALANFMTEIGAEGVCQEALMPAYFTEDAFETASYETLTAHFPQEDKETVIASLEAYLDGLSMLFPENGKPTFTLQDITDPNWGEEWKKYFHPLRIGKKFVIKPTWEPYQPAGDDIVIEIDPGMAFGTGQHHSTAMCLEAMEDLFLSNGSPRDVLDVGTGTGILGIAATCLGAEKVVCIDIDDQAVAIAVDNAILNQVAEKMEILNRPLLSLGNIFDLILANLTAKTLLELSAHLESRMAPGGHLVISGIIEQQSPEIEERFSRPPLKIERIMRSQEWRCYVITKE
jgi:ribosomal protein L11 methyltransferase